MQTLDRYRIILFSCLCLFIVAAAEVATIITSVSPDSIKPEQLSILFAASLVVATGLVYLPWLGIKRIFWPSRKPKPIVHLRQACLISLLPVGAAFLNSLQILRIWEALPLAASLLLLELFFEAETPQT